MERRGFLKLVGGGVVLAAAGLAYNAQRFPDAAIAPWADAGQGHDDPRLHALSYAILAPNPHNRQPWMAKLEGDDALTLHVDPDRLLPHTDPFNRQITIGLGCFLELLRMAAAEQGQAVEITPFPEGGDAAALDGRPVARVVFDGAATADPLFAHYHDRRSLKEPFDTTRTVPDAALAAIIAAAQSVPAGGSIAENDIAFWRQLTRDALLVEIETPRIYKESVDLFRFGKAEVNANPDGIDFTGPLFQTLTTFGLMTREAALDTSSTMYTQGIDAVLANTDTAMGHVWLVSATNSRADQIRTGADWLRMNLAATAQGIGFQPLSQALQEYPEMSAYYDETHARLAPDGGTVQMLSRIGYGPQVPVSPRWPLEAKLMS
ncbi:Acg family FMN-binding oxidoreductase [Yoonia sp. 208BN28-4]|uniref:Acg family FMN-binding oxidoreductase n=1 Tax=Yoonia sp. 208BN28-4 TaxID=3126505 RepID=UPI00309B4A33